MKKQTLTLGSGASPSLKKINMHPIKCVKYLNLPTIPRSVIDSIKFDDDALAKAKSTYGYATSVKSTEELNQWGRENISEDIFLNYQLITGPAPNSVGKIHKDTSTKTKLMYIVNTGGDKVVTTFYTDEAGSDEMFHITVDPCRWAILEADAWHHVTGLASGEVRFAITGQVFRSEHLDIREIY